MKKSFWTSTKLNFSIEYTSSICALGSIIVMFKIIFSDSSTIIFANLPPLSETSSVTAYVPCEFPFYNSSFSFSADSSSFPN